MSVLIVAEKPSIAEAIAKALGGRYSTSRMKTPVHTWRGTWHGQSLEFRCMGVTGHCFEIDFTSAYRNWDSTDPADLFTAPIVRKPADAGRGVINQLERLSKGIDYLHLWLDCDREGENICFEVISVVKKNMSRRVRGQQIFRAHFSSIAATDIKKAFGKLGSPNKNESDAVEARQELDLKIGVAFTRFQTRFFSNKYGQLNKRRLVSYGPCQAPTLGFCVQRADERSWFNKEDYWKIIGECKKPSWKGGLASSLKLSWARGKVFDEDVANLYYLCLRRVKMAKCVRLRSKESKRSRPLPLNTVALLQAASKGLGMGPKETMHIAERLYLKGFLSYPRTETTSYPGDFDIRGTLMAQSRDDSWGAFARTLATEGWTKPRKGVDAGDHPAISPVAYASGLAGNERRLYEFVVRHFIATVSPDCVVQETDALFELEFDEPSHQTVMAVASASSASESKTAESLTKPSRVVECELDLKHSRRVEVFSASGTAIVDPGFTAVATWSRVSENAFPMDLNEGDMVPMTNLSIRKDSTEPPPFLTEAELIALMDKHGIGTDASIPVHIANICERDYVRVDSSSRTLRPTMLGTLLAHGYHKIDPDLVLPKLRAYMERMQTKIAKGHSDKEAVVRYCLKVFRAKYAYFVAKFDKLDRMFEGFYDNGDMSKQGRPKQLSKCGICHKIMNLYSLRPPPKLHCADCSRIYRLPIAEDFSRTSRDCPMCKFEILRVTEASRPGQVARSYCLCPHCFVYPPGSEGPFAEMDGQSSSKKDDSHSSGSRKRKSGPKGESLARLKDHWRSVESSVDPDKVNIEHLESAMSCGRCWNPSCDWSAANTTIRPCEKCHPKVYEGMGIVEEEGGESEEEEWFEEGTEEDTAEEEQLTVVSALSRAQLKDLESEVRVHSAKVRSYWTLDPFSGPKRWKAACSNPRCFNKMDIEIHARSVQCLREGAPKCGDCNGSLLRINFVDVPSSLAGRTSPDGNFTGCVFCDGDLAALTSLQSRVGGRAPRMRGRGKGGSRGGRGRGKRGARGRGRGRGRGRTRGRGRGRGR